MATLGAPLVVEVGSREWGLECVLWFIFNQCPAPHVVLSPPSQLCWIHHRVKSRTHSQTVSCFSAFRFHYSALLWGCQVHCEQYNFPTHLVGAIGLSCCVSVLLLMYSTHAQPTNRPGRERKMCTEMKNHHDRFNNQNYSHKDNFTFTAFC